MGVEDLYAPQAGYGYGGFLMEYWKITCQKGTEFRYVLIKYHFEKDGDSISLLDPRERDVAIQFAAMLSTLWKELRPTVMGRTDMKDIETLFMSFGNMARAPETLLTPTELHPNPMMELEECLRTVIDRLKITTWAPGIK